VRTDFAHALLDAAAADDRIWLLCGDLGYSVLEPFAARFPDRFVNVGVAEQNMTGVAAGLAMTGRIVVTYSIANFPVFRCLEQLRVDVCYHRLNVKVVAVGGGLAYGGQGYTHHGVEDLAAMRILPHMTVMAPADPQEARLATHAMLRHDGPCYLRLGKAGEPAVHAPGLAFEIGRAVQCRDGAAATVVSTGGTLTLALAAADQLAAEGLAVRVLSMHTVAPLDLEALRAASRDTGGLVTVEEHGTGGLADAVATALLTAGVAPAHFAAVRLAREPVSGAGSQEYLRAKGGVDVTRIVDAVRAMRP
jgi:transketolase